MRAAISHRLQEKLTVLLKLLDEKNVQLVLTELREYCSEIDVEFVKRTVKAIGYCAMQVDSAAHRCVEILLEVIKEQTGSAARFPHARTPPRSAPHDVALRVPVDA